MNKKTKKKPKKKSAAFQRHGFSSEEEVRAHLQRPGVAQASHILIAAKDALNRMPERDVVDPLIDVVYALAAAVVDHGGTDALEAEAGPVRWARAYLAQPLDRADAAREFIAHVQSYLMAHLPGWPHDGEPLEKQIVAHQFVWDMNGYVNTVCRRQGLLDGHDEPQTNAQAISIAEVQKVAKRSPLKAYDFAIALLVGWGVERLRAHTLLRPSERKGTQV